MTYPGVGTYSPTAREPSGWAVGWIFFAATMMILIGTFHIVTGLVGIINDDFYVKTNNYVLQFSSTTWGWINLAVGVVVLLAGIFLFTGSLFARTVGVIMTAISVFAAFSFLPWYPVWSIVIIALGIAVIWALTAHGRDIVST
jgi:hypothetical protein